MISLCSLRWKNVLNGQQSYQWDFRLASLISISSYAKVTHMMLRSYTFPMLHDLELYFGWNICRTWSHIFLGRVLGYFFLSKIVAYNSWIWTVVHGVPNFRRGIPHFIANTYGCVYFMFLKAMCIENICVSKKLPHSFPIKFQKCVSGQMLSLNMKSSPLKQY